MRNVRQVRRLNALVFAAAWALQCAAAAGSSCALIVLRGDGVVLRMDAELAVSQAARATGFMGRTGLPSGTGMLFDFGIEQPVAMWMKDTLLPLDMWFIAADGRVVQIESDASPLSTALIRARRPVRYVLEINAGESAMIGAELPLQLVLSSVEACLAMRVPPK